MYTIDIVELLLHFLRIRQELLSDSSKSRHRMLLNSGQCFGVSNWRAQNLSKILAWQQKGNMLIPPL